MQGTIAAMHEEDGPMDLKQQRMEPSDAPIPDGLDIASLRDDTDGFLWVPPGTSSANPHTPTYPPREPRVQRWSPIGAYDSNARTRVSWPFGPRLV